MQIATAYGLPVQAIMATNGIVDQNKIFAGQILELPLASAIVATSLPGGAGAPPATPAVPATTAAAP
jgi:LysM repeat protein